MNKLLAGAVSTALFFAVVAPTFAMGMDNVAIIKGNDVTVGANSGNNLQGATTVAKFGSNGGGVVQSQKTGNAEACGVQVIGANITLGHGHSDNLAVVKGNDLGVGADSGNNGQGATTVAKFGSNGGGVVQGQLTGTVKAKGGQLVVANLKIGH